MPRGIPLKKLKTAVNRTLRIKKGMKVSEILKRAMQSEELEEFSKARAKRDRAEVERMLDKLMKDEGVAEVMLKRRERTLKGRKPRGYIEVKLKNDAEYAGPNPEKYFKKGGSVKVKCKLGRNRSTKLY